MNEVVHLLSTYLPLPFCPAEMTFLLCLFCFVALVRNRRRWGLFGWI
jgi:hypothetical protein